MKNRISKILGLGLALVLTLALVAGFAVPAAASPGENEWELFDYPKAGSAGDWFRDAGIEAVGPMAEAINGDLYAYVGSTLGTATLFDLGGGTAAWSTVRSYSGSYSAKLTAPTSSDYAKVKLVEFAIPEAFSGFAAPSFYYKIADDAVTTTESIIGTWPIYVRSGDVVTQGYLSAYPVINITDGTDSISIIGQPWAESTSACWREWDNAQASGIYGEALWHDGFVTDPGIAGIPAKWGPLSWWQTNYAGWDVVDVGVGLGFFALTGKQSAHVDLVTISGVTYDIEAAGNLVSNQLFKSEDGGRTWALTGYDGGVVDMVCSSIDEDILYVTDGNYVYKSTDAGDEFTFVARASLEEAITGTCGCTIGEQPITCIDVAYDDDEDPFVFIGTRFTGLGTPSDGAASVLWIGEGLYPKEWTDLKLDCYDPGAGYEAYAVGCAPNWADSRETYVVVSNGTETHVVSTIGGYCDWDEFAELFWDCDDDNPFGIQATSRIAFPDDWEDSETLFVGVVDKTTVCHDTSIGNGGDVYMVWQDGAHDMNVAGIGPKGGCVGAAAVDIISLDIYGDTDEAALIAGAYCDTNVYCSEDGGWSWDISAKDPTGESDTYVLWYEDTALAATSGCECAVSMCCGEDFPCEFWNQISLIATDITTVEDISHSPGYVVDSETLFMLTDDTHSGSLFRYDGTYWERVYCSTIADGVFDWVLASPDFNDTNAVFVANIGFEIWRSLDAGCSWKKMTFPCTPRPTISAVVVIDEDTVITGGAGDGLVYKTTRHGARPWQKYDVATTGDVMSFDLEPGYDDPGTIILGTSKSEVFISEDGGEEWELVDAALNGTADTFVVFDPDYASNSTIYAAAGEVIARCVIDPDEDMADQEWEEIYTAPCGAELDASGIVAAGDTALYVADKIALGDVVADCVAPVGNETYTNAKGGVLRSLNPDTDDADEVVFERVTAELTSGRTLSGLQLTTASNVLWSLDIDEAEVWTYEDTLAAPVVLDMPIDGQKLGTATKATLSWQELDDATLYEVSLYRYCPECPELKEEIEVEDTKETCITIKDLDTGSLYYWQVRVALGSPTLSKWSEERTFTTAILDVATLCSPVCGGQDIILTPNFSWDKVSGATGYNIELATTETFTAGVVRGKSTVNAWVAPAPLEYATTYYWRVRAEKDGVFSDWSVCIFTTMAKPVAPTPPVTITPAPPPTTITIPPAEMITPNWIYAIVGIGAALCVVVIVLIVRTRRPPA